MWYEWNTQEDFDTWHNNLCAALGYPLTGVNQETGLPDEDAAKTVAYTTSKQVDDKVIAMVEDEYSKGLIPTNLRPAAFNDNES